jgi:hypothetical protein
MGSAQIHGNPGQAAAEAMAVPIRKAARAVPVPAARIGRYEPLARRVGIHAGAVALGVPVIVRPAAPAEARAPVRRGS